MEEQVREFHPDKVALLDEAAAADLRVRIADTNTKVLSGIGGICECATDPNSDTVLNSIVGIAGLLPTMDAIEAGKTIALANKETLVTGGLPVPRGRTARAAAQTHPSHGLRRSLLRPVEREPEGRHRRTGTEPSELVHGSENHHRFRYHDEQGTRSHRSLLALRCLGRQDQSRRPSREHHPLRGPV